MTTQRSGSTKVAHLLYSGLGGHGALFFAMREAGQALHVSQCPLFYGVEPLRTEYASICQATGTEFAFIEKNHGLDLRGQWALLRHLRKIGPSTIFIHSHSGFPAALAYKALRPRTKLLFIEHQSPNLKSRSGWIASAAAPLLCNSVVYLTELSRDEIKLRTKWTFRPSRSPVIPNGINLSRFAPAQHKAKELTSIRLGMVSRLMPLKDFETLFRAMARLDGLKYQLLLAGDGESRIELEALRETLGLTSEITFLGTLDETDLISFFQSLDIYVHSTHGETMSTAIMQALGCGLAVVASRVSGVTNQLEHNVDGVLVTPRDPDALAQSIIELAENPEKRQQLGVAARLKAEREYSHDVMWGRYHRVIQSP